MTDDIVTRLRDLLDGPVPMTVERQDVRDALAEIERLRADVKRWRDWAEYFFYTDPDCECPTCDQVRAAIRSTK